VQRSFFRGSVPINEEANTYNKKYKTEFISLGNLGKLYATQIVFILTSRALIKL
jgi:hypothetical protein